MTITPDMVDYLRTMVRGDHHANDLVEARLDQHGWQGFARLLGAVFFFAVDRRFGPRPDDRAIAQFVTDLADNQPPDGPAIAAADAEILVKAVLDPGLEFDIEPGTVGKIQILAIFKILSDEAITDQDLDALLDEAAELANRGAMPPGQGAVPPG